MDEKQLIERIVKGDTRAFEELVYKYQKMVYGTALRLCKNPDDAQDISQEVFIKLYKSLASFKFASSLSTYIYRITTNLCLDFMRKRGEVFSLTDDETGQVSEVEDKSENPEEKFFANERRRIFEQALDSLSYEHREMITLRDINGLSYREISEATSLPENTVKTRILRAREKLREILKKSGNYFDKV